MNRARRLRGAASRKAGRQAEVLAMIWLMLRGYRILGFRLRTPQAEIDILAQKGPVLAVVEVKSRTTPMAALEAVGQDQRERLRRAGRAIATSRPQLAESAIRLDLIAMSPGRFPTHIQDAWRGG
ncbi:MAG: YraN family protein [Alphaproteobacteria bacterium]